MAVYDLNKPRRDNGKLYRGVYRNSAADLPPQNKCKDICRKENEPVIGDIKPKNDKKFFDGIIDEFFDGGVDYDTGEEMPPTVASEAMPYYGAPVGKRGNEIDMIATLISHISWLEAEIDRLRAENERLTSK